ncbi:MAG: M14 family zinc carboxypeptidase [Anaerolineae bacterium]
MVGLDGDFPGGNCVFDGVRDGVLHCRPDTPENVSGAHWFTFIARLTGAVGPSAEICLHWPENDPEYETDYPENRNFATVLDRTIHTSVDLVNWEPVEDVQLEGQTARFTVASDVKPLYVSVGIPFLPGDLEALFADAAQHPDAEVFEVARTPRGRPVRGIRVGGGPGVKEAFYLQAFQHTQEWAGGRVIASMVRYLLSEAGASLRTRFSWHFVPCLNLDGFLGGWREDDRGNMNRDWQRFEMPETQGVKTYIEGLRSQGLRLWHGLDLHMGWYNRASSGSGILTYELGSVSDAVVAFQEDFAQHVTTWCGFSDVILRSRDPASWPTFSSWMWNAFGLPGQTVEFSRHLFLDRDTDRWEILRQEHEEQLGCDLADALGAFLWSVWDEDLRGHV